MKIIDRTNEIVFIDDLIYGATFKRIGQESYGYFMKINQNDSELDYNAIDLQDGSLCDIEHDEVLLVVDCTLTVEQKGNKANDEL